jgi:hypothetical protein
MTHEAAAREFREWLADRLPNTFFIPSQNKPSGYAMAAQRAGESHDAKAKDELDGRVKAWYRLQRMKRERKVRESIAAFDGREGTGDE